MAKQIPFLINCFFFFITSVSSQDLNRNYIDGINIGTRKSVVIDTVMSKLRMYVENDVDGVLSFIRKKYKVKISNKNQWEEFVTHMQDDLRTQLQTTNEWNTIDSYGTYGVYFSKLLGHYIRFPGYGEARKGRNGNGNCDLYFKNEILTAVYGNLEVTTDYSIHSGYNYDNNHLTNSATILRKNYGSFTFKQGATIWNSCSTNPENVPVITYNFNADDDYTASFTFTYGIYQRKIAGNKNQCVAAGNHLTSIAFYIAKK